MDISRIKYLRGELESEQISYSELSEIETAFAEIPDGELRDVRENAMAGDMLDELESRVSLVEKTLYDFVYDNFGESEANDPSYSISQMAEAVNSMTIHFGAEMITLRQFLEGE